MKALKFIGDLLWFALGAAWEVLTVSEPKADDGECGVELGGQGR